MSKLLRSSCYFSVALLVITLPLSLLAQPNPIPNAGFEEWTDNTPNGWTVALNVSGSETVIRSDDSHTGAFAARIGPNTLYAGVLTPLLSAGDDPFNPGFAVSERFDNLSVFLKHFPLNRDSLSIEVIMNIGFTSIGSGQMGFQDTVSSYTQFTIPISYWTSGVPDKAFINVTVRGIGNADPTVGTFSLLDDWEFDGSTISVEDNPGQPPTDFALKQNYPNPFNPETIISFTIPRNSKVTLAIYNLRSQLIRTLHSGLITAGSHQTTWDGTDISGVRMASGIYMYRLVAKDFVTSKKLVMVK